MSAYSQIINIQLRSLKPAHYKQIIALWQRAELPSRPSGRDSEDEIKNQMKRDPELFIGAFEDEKLVGTIIGTDDGRKGWLNRIAVDPDYRRKGIGRALVEECERRFRTRERRIFGVQVEDWNEDSLKFFEDISYVLHREILYLSKRESEDV
ncbi:MAG: GNAT family N-acetyltransferase [Thermoplasmata archaeon]|nr:GNAT family N-acetyltransferase [Thermoplasmata archaeon]